MKYESICRNKDIRKGSTRDYGDGCECKMKDGIDMKAIREYVDRCTKG